MKFSEAWLREWVNPDLDTQQLAEQLTMAGLEVDSVEPVAAAFSGVVVAEVLSVEAHPDAEKLRVCRVSTGGPEALQIVCGAPNVRAGMKAPLATVGGTMPGDMKIKRAKLRGVESQGMLCSARELGLSEDHQGLMDLPADAPVGRDLRDYLGLEDSSIDVDLTPNRGDCLGVLGMAREVGALNRRDVSLPAFEAVQPAIDDQIPLAVQAPEACPRYLGRVIRGIDPGRGTPLWMQEKLRRSGIRSLGPVVDVTNYVLLELGQPMHAFDLARISGGINVRYAQRDETLTLLDGRSIVLEPDTLLICDQRKALALAGIMGGADSGIGEATRDLFLEVAFFAPEHIAGRARRYGMNTDSSYRFERGVDPQLQRRAMERATALLLELVGGEAGPVTEAVSPEHLPEKRAIVLRRARIGKLLGFLPSDGHVEDILSRLGVTAQRTEEGWMATAPGYRFDLALEPDLIEEIGRVYGYNNLPVSRSRGELILRPEPEGSTSLQRIQSLLVDRDYQEIISYSFVDASLLQSLDPQANAVALANPISSEMSVMRTSLWPGLVGALRYNQARQQGRIRLFETGLRFVTQLDELKQKNSIAGLVTGDRWPEQWGVARQESDFYDLKADVEALLTCCGLVAQFRGALHPALHPGQSAVIYINGREAGWIGCIHPGVARELEISSKTYLFELELDVLLKRRIPSFQKLSRFPSIRRDLAVVVEAGTPAAVLCETIARTAGELLQDLRVFDVYQGEGIESGRKSIAFGLILQGSSRTLTDTDVDSLMQGITGQLEQQFGATLRE